MTSRIIIKSVVKRKSGYLYFIDGQGNLCEAKMLRQGRVEKKNKKKDKKGYTKTIAKKKAELEKIRK